MTELDTSSEATQSIAIDGLIFTCPAPYADGDTINLAEAKTLNQTFAENLRNNFRKQVVEAREKANGSMSEEILASLTAKFSVYANEYEFSGKRGIRTPVDPVEKEANKIARERVREAIKAKGWDMKTMAEGQFEKLVANLLAQDPAYREIARQRVELSQSLAAAILE